MSENCREFVQGALVLIAAVAVGLITACLIIKLHHSEPSPGPVEQVLHSQP